MLEIKVHDGKGIVLMEVTDLEEIFTDLSTAIHAVFDAVVTHAPEIADQFEATFRKALKDDRYVELLLKRENRAGGGYAS